jgi:hypothetical protein
MKALSVDGIEKTISEVDIEGVDDLEFLLGGGSLVSDDLDPEHQIFLMKIVLSNRSMGVFR